MWVCICDLYINFVKYNLRKKSMHFNASVENSSDRSLISLSIDLYENKQAYLLTHTHLWLAPNHDTETYINYECLTFAYTYFLLTFFKLN